MLHVCNQNKTIVQKQAKLLVYFAVSNVKLKKEEFHKKKNNNNLQGPYLWSMTKEGESGGP